MAVSLTRCCLASAQHVWGTNSSVLPNSSDPVLPVSCGSLTSWRELREQLIPQTHQTIKSVGIKMSWSYIRYLPTGSLKINQNFKPQTSLLLCWPFENQLVQFSGGVFLQDFWLWKSKHFTSWRHKRTNLSAAYKRKENELFRPNNPVNTELKHQKHFVFLARMKCFIPISNFFEFFLMSCLYIPSICFALFYFGLFISSSSSSICFFNIVGFYFGLLFQVLGFCHWHL